MSTIATVRNNLYKVAVEYLAKSRETKLAQIQTLKESLQEVKSNKAKRWGRRQLYDWQVQADKLIPNWRPVNVEKADLNIPVQREWRRALARDVDIPFLTQRSQCMRVLEDFPLIVKNQSLVDLSFAAADVGADVAGVGADDKKEGKADKVLAGTMLTVKDTLNPPQVKLTRFQTQERLFTLALIDLDYPDLENQRYQTYCHWLIRGIPFGIQGTWKPSTDSITLLNYIPPHPFRGMKYHRYLMCAYKEPLLPTPPSHFDQKQQRVGFDLVDYAKLHQLELSGWTFFRCKWESDGTVEKIYQSLTQVERLPNQQEAPTFVRPEMVK